jgi:hypothetical protein
MIMKTFLLCWALFFMFLIGTQHFLFGGNELWMVAFHVIASAVLGLAAWVSYGEHKDPS